VSQHLDHCINCRRELSSLSTMHNKLRGLNNVSAPAYLGALVQRRIVKSQQESWSKQLRNELERCWSKVRTIEGMWYVTRAMGTVMASLFFVLISFAITPYYMTVSNASAPLGQFTTLSPSYRQQVGVNVLKKLGIPAQAQIVNRSQAAINNLYILEFGENVSKTGKDDSFSVVTEVDRSGSAKIQNVLQYPEDRDLLDNFNEMISIARCRPASENGHAVASHLVFMFSTISVYN